MRGKGRGRGRESLACEGSVTRKDVAMPPPAAYGREFMRLKRFAPTLVNIELKMDERFILGLDPEIRHRMEAIDPTIYETDLITTKAMEKPRDEVCRESIVTIERKRLYKSRDSHRQPLTCRPRYVDIHPLDMQIDALETKKGQEEEEDQSAMYVENRVGVGVWLELEHILVWPRGPHCYELHDQEN